MMKGKNRYFERGLGIVEASEVKGRLTGKAERGVEVSQTAYAGDALGFFDGFP